jgi:hypothetical protein
VPRKYHRPPDTTTKRRKTRRSPVPYEFEAPPVETAVEEETFEDGDDSPVATAEYARSTSTGAARGERHVMVDYGYVRSEIVRIAVIMAFLIIALVITSIFR